MYREPDASQEPPLHHFPLPPLGTVYSKFYLGAENLLNYRNVKLNSQACVNMWPPKMKGLNIKVMFPTILAQFKLLLIV